MFAPLPNQRFDIILADPPWSYDNRIRPTDDAKRGAADHYPTLPPDALAELPVASIAADDCLLFLWATGPCLPEAFAVAKGWGFAYATVAFVWDKCAIMPGSYTLGQCEYCLVLKRGRIPRPRGARNIRQLITERRTAHSAKPEEARRRIEAMFPQQSKVELFARQRVDGWEAWGNDRALY